MYENASNKSKKAYYETLEDAIKNIVDIISDSCDMNEKPAVLIKASHGMHFEKIVEELKKSK